MTTTDPISPDIRRRLPVWRRPFRLIRDNLRTYLLINVAAYGLFLVGFAIGIAFPELNEARTAALVENGTGDLVFDLLSSPVLFGLVIFAINFFQLSILTIVLPSLIVPFAGWGFFAFWIVQTGVTIAPNSPTSWVHFIPHSLTLVIEVQAYVLLLLGVYLLGRSWLFPRTVDAKNRRQGYVRGLQRLGLLALPAVGLLVVGAAWEAFSLSTLLHPLRQLLL
jgi:hypothetical protein